MDIHHHHFETIDSTNTWAKKNASSFNRNSITLITADEQTAGRGRLNRQWISPPHQNIYATFCFFVPRDRQDIGNIPQILALAAANVLINLQFLPQLKWPNDVLLSNKKVAGILCETTTHSDETCVIIGIGLNVNMPLELLEKIDRPATSLAVVAKKHFSVPKILELLKHQFVENLSQFLKDGFSPFLEPYRHLIVFKPHQPIRLHDNREICEGKFVGINSDGSLKLEHASGLIQSYHIGEIL